jgi:hypothetical protein
MALLGDWNWYFPGWLEWLPKIHIEGPHPAAQPVVAGIDQLEGLGASAPSSL